VKKMFVCHVQNNGILTDADRILIANFIKDFPGKPLRIEISQYRKRISDAQRGYFHAVVIPLVNRALRDRGNVVNEEVTKKFLVAEVMKWGTHIKMANGEWKFVVGSSEDIPADDMPQMMEIVRAWAVEELKIQIPLPGEGV